MLNRDFREFVGLLAAHGVEYLVVGGFALAAHGRPRYTGDLDLWIGRTAANVDRLLAALRAFGFGSLGLEAADFLAEDTVVQLGVAPGRIDLMTGIDGVRFEDAWPRRLSVAVAGVELPVIHVDDFRTNKRATGRLRDLADLDDLDRDAD